MVEWTKEDRIRATVEGWAIFEGKDGLYIARIDDPAELDEPAICDPIFKSNAAALAHVKDEADRGSPFHARALAYIAQERS